MIRTAQLVAVLAVVSIFSGCGPMTGTDGGTDGGGTDAGMMSGDAGPQKITGSAEAIIVQNGRFVIGGTSFKAMNDDDFQLVRLSADGGLDSTFGTNGKATLTWPTFIDPVVADAGFIIEQKTDQVFALTLQGDKILAAGTAQSQGGRSGFFAVARFSADGVLDTTFGTAGKTELRQNLGSLAQAVAIRSDGKIYLAGFSARGLAGDPNATDFGLVRLSADGVVDSTFGGATGVQSDFGKNEDARGIAFDGNKVLVGGGDDFAVARYNDDGSLDMSFGVLGVAKSADGVANTFTRLSDGSILLSGARRTSANSTFTIKLVRYTASGQLDGTFGTGGVAEIPYNEQQNAVLALAVLSDGRVAAFLQAALTVNATRFSATGALDTGFGTGGLTELPTSLNILVAGAIPASANHGVLVGNQFFFASTDAVSTNAPLVVFTSTTF
ncbi:MAG: hypothetical protein QM817_19870 [Archangium sp.]